jgi:predicted RNase H-like nuclease (RuvC/YqgF family)
MSADTIVTHDTDSPQESIHELKREIERLNRLCDEYQDDASYWRREAEDLDNDCRFHDQELERLKEDHSRELYDYEQRIWRIINAYRDVFMLDLIGRNNPFEVLELLITELAHQRRLEASDGGEVE